MKVLSLTTRNFKNLPDQEWCFDPNFQVVAGLNEAGKSSLLEAILVGLYGDATSKDQRYARLRRWNSTEHISVRLKLLVKDGECTLERDFESGKNRLVHDNKPIQAKDKIRAWLAERLPLPTEEGFRQTACVRQDELRCDLRASDLRLLIERHSLTATDQDLGALSDNLRDWYEELRRGWKTSAPKNPGPIKRLQDELAGLRSELAELEGKEIDASRALAEYEQACAAVDKKEEDLSQAEERRRLDNEYVQAEGAYKQRAAEIAELGTKLERLKKLPHLIEETETEHARLTASLDQSRTRSMNASSWKQKSTELAKLEEAHNALAAEIEQLKSNDAEMKARVNPLESTGLVLDDFMRFQTLQQQASQCNLELERDRKEVRTLTEGIDGARKQKTLADGEKQSIQDQVETLKGQKAVAERVSEAARRQQLLAQEKQKLSPRIEQFRTLNSEKSALMQELAAYQTLERVDADEFRKALTTIKALEEATQDEGIGFEIDPQRGIELTVQLDGGAEEKVRLEHLQKFVARREIAVQIPGLGRLRLTNESQSARLLGQQRAKVAHIVSEAEANDTPDLLTRLARRDERKAQLNMIDAKLQTALEARPLESWEKESADLDTQLENLSKELAELGMTRDLPSIVKDLQNSQNKLNEIDRNLTQATTRMEVLTRQLETTQQTIVEREVQLRKLRDEMVAILKRGGQEDEAGLRALKEKHDAYQSELAAMRDRRARILKGRREEDIHSLFKAQEERLQSLRVELDQLSVHAMTDNELAALQCEIEKVKQVARTKGDELAGLKRERQLLEAEQLSGKYQEAVTQAAIAEDKRKQFVPYAFANPAERIDHSHRIDKLRIDLKRDQRRQAELKVRSDAYGVGQARIAVLKETIAERERQLTELERRFEIDGLVLEFMEKAREKALADLQAAIPESVASLLRRITAGKYDRVEGAGFNLQPWSTDKNGVLEIGEMSRGTLDQFYLSLRLEALRATFLKDLPPFILDDALAFSDPQRRSVLLEVLREYAASGQVIYLSCQDWPELQKFACLHLGRRY